MINIKSQKEIDRPFNLLAWGHWFTLGNLFLALLFSFFYISASPLPETFLGWSYLAINWVSHFSFLALACFILTIFPIITIFPYKGHIRGLSAMMASIFQFLLFLDVLSYWGLGYHLSTSSISQLREVEDVYVASIGNGYWVLLLAVFIFILVYQFTVSNFTWKRIEQLQRIRLKNIIARTLITLFFISHLGHMAADATSHSDIAKQSNLFPLSYPLTAKTLLAEYELIDLKKYEESKLKQFLVSPTNFTTQPIEKINCELNSTPNLNVVFINSKEFINISQWLLKNNIYYQTHNQFNLPSDLNTAVFNVTTGLPGLYQTIEERKPLEINAHIQHDKISVEVHHGAYKTPKRYGNHFNSRAYIFYDEDSKQPFYRTKVILIGFKPIYLSEVIMQPQNIAASYLSEQLNCSEYVQNNLIDLAISELHSDSIFTNYSNGYFNVVYKDKYLLFQDGKLIENKAFSNNKTLNDFIDLSVIEKAINSITSRRIKVLDEN